MLSKLKKKKVNSKKEPKLEVYKTFLETLRKKVL